MNSKKKILSLCLTIALVAMCIVGVLMFSANAEDSYTQVYAVGTDGADVRAILKTVANQSWAAGDSVKITFTTAQGQQTSYTQLSSGEYIGIAWDVPTIFRADGTKLPITIQGPSATTNLLVGYNNAKAYTVFTNDYTFSTLRFNSFNTGYVLAGSGNIVLNKVGFTGTPTYAADNITARAYAGWTAENFAANAIDGKTQSSMTMTNGTVYGSMMSSSVQKLFTSVAFNSSALANQAAADALTFLEADSYPLAPKVAETRAKLVFDYNGTYTINGNYFDLKGGFSPCECAFVMKQGTLVNTSTAANTLRLRKNVAAGKLDFGDYDVQILGGTLGGMRGAQCNPAHYGDVSFTFGEVGTTGPTVNDALQFSWDGAVIYGDANMTINSGTFKGAVYGPINLADKNGKFTINGGTFQAAVYGGMQTARHTSDIALNSEFNGGTFEAAVYLSPSNNYNANVHNVAINYTLNGGTFDAGLPKIAKATNDGYTYTINNTVNTTVTDFFGFNGGIAATGTIHNTIGADAAITNFYGGASSDFAFTGNVTTDFIGGTVTNYYGGSEDGTLTGNVVNNFNGGTIGTNYYGGNKAGTLTGTIANNFTSGNPKGVYGGSKAGTLGGKITNTITGGTFTGNTFAGCGGGTQTVDVENVISGGTFANFYGAHTAASAGNVVNNISGGTFNVFYGARVHADTITTTISGDATFNSYFYGAPMNGGIADIVVSTTVNGGTFKSAYYGGGNAESHIASITNTINGGEFKTTFNGGNRNGTSGVACPADITNVITGGTFTGVYYGGAEAGNGTGDITNTISGGDFDSNVFGGSKAGSNSGNIENNISGTATIAGNFYGSHNVATAGDVVNNISGGTFGGTYYGLWHYADSVTNNVTGGTFDGANFYAGQLNGATSAVNITNTITGGTFATSMYFYGGASDTLVGTINTTLDGVTIAHFFGGNRIGTVADINNTLKNGFTSSEYYGGSDGGTQTGTITNNVLDAEITTFFAGAKANTVANTVCNNVYGGTFVNYYIAGNLNGNADDVVISNIYGGDFARNFLVGARNVAETINTAPVVNIFTDPAAVNFADADSANVIIFRGPIVSDFTGRDALNGTNGVANINGGSKAIEIYANFALNAASVTGNVTFTQMAGWNADQTYLTAPAAAENLVTMQLDDGLIGSIAVTVADGTAAWTATGGALYGAQILFNDMGTIRVFFNKDVIDAQNTWVFNITGIPLAAAINGTKADLTFDEENNMYYYELPAIAASKFYNSYNLTTSTNDTKTFSIMTLCNAGIEAFPDNTALVNLLKTLYNYGYEAYTAIRGEAPSAASLLEGVEYDGRYSTYMIDSTDYNAGDVKFTGCAMHLGGATGIRFYIKANAEPTILIDGLVAKPAYYTINEIAAEDQASFGGANYELIISVKAKFFTTPFTIAARVGETTATLANVTVPAAANMNTTQPALMNALRAFVAAAEEYVAANA